MTDCKELIGLFEKVGGILICDYNNKIVKVNNTNLYCNIKSNDYKNLEKIYVDYVFSPYETEKLTNDKLSVDEISKSTIKFVNKFLNNNDYGYKITYLN